MHIHPLITDRAELEKLVKRLSDAPFVAIDTEFMRENVYFPDLCLVQIAGNGEAAAIDPKAEGMKDLDPLMELLTRKDDTLKVFHAGGQDVEIIYNMTGTTPLPIFDTQIAAMALGQGEQIGYAGLVEAWLGHQLDKGARFTDWARRPLDKRQIDYAIGDVTHLAEIFPSMLDRLRETGRGAWLNEEMEKLADPANYRVDPNEVWRRVKVQSRKADVLGRLKALAAWREEEARRKDLPRGRIVKDETLADIASHPPKQQSDLSKIRGLSTTWNENDIGKRMMAALAKAQPLPRDEMPDRGGRGPSLGKEGALVADLLKLLLKIRAKEIDVASKLISRSDDLERLAAGEREGIGILEGWRFEQFGRDALDLVEGRMAFTVVGNKLKMTRTQQDNPADQEETDTPAS